jgi:hypothetical protein
VGWIRARDLEVVTAQAASRPAPPAPATATARPAPAPPAPAPARPTTTTAAARPAPAAARPAPPAAQEPPSTPTVTRISSTQPVTAGLVTGDSLSAARLELERARLEYEQLLQGRVPLPGPTTAIPTRQPIGDAPRRILGMGGLSMGPHRTMALGGQFSMRVSRRLEMILEGGQLADVLPPSIRDEADRIAGVLSQVGGDTVRADARVPAMYGIGGMRFTTGGPGAVRPYVEGHAGFAQLTPQVSFIRRGQDITRSVAGAAFQTDSSNLLFGVTGGVVISVGGPATIDLGYRFVRAYEAGAPSFDMGRVVLGLGARF